MAEGSSRIIIIRPSNAFSRVHVFLFNQRTGPLVLPLVNTGSNAENARLALACRAPNDVRNVDHAISPDRELIWTVAVMPATR
jgi:hypothetical protein